MSLCMRLANDVAMQSLGPLAEFFRIRYNHGLVAVPFLCCNVIVL